MIQAVRANVRSSKRKEISIVVELAAQDFGGPRPQVAKGQTIYIGFVVRFNELAACKLVEKVRVKST